MKQHDMFKLMQGNPPTITLIAAIHAKKLGTNYKDQLVDLYHSFKNEYDTVAKGLDELQEENQESYQKHLISLDIATELSIRLLKETNPKDMSLLYFLGCLPSGVRT